MFQCTVVRIDCMHPSTWCDCGSAATHLSLIHIQMCIRDRDRGQQRYITTHLRKKWLCETTATFKNFLKVDESKIIVLTGKFKPISFCYMLNLIEISFLATTKGLLTLKTNKKVRAMLLKILLLNIKGYRMQFSQLVLKIISFKWWPSSVIHVPNQVLKFCNTRWMSCDFINAISQRRIAFSSSTVHG